MKWMMVVCASLFFASSIGLAIGTRKNRKPLTDAMVLAYFTMGIGAALQVWARTDTAGTIIYFVGGSVMCYGVYRQYRERREQAKTKVQ